MSAPAEKKQTHHIPKQVLKAQGLPGRLEVGLDEVGRGALISRVMAGAVAFPPELAVDRDPDNLFSKIRDSKKVSALMRERMYDFIRENALVYSTGWADEKEIDMLNIRRSTMLSFHRALDSLTQPADFLLVDGNAWDEYTCPTRGVVIPHMCVIQGDNTFVPIAAAALLAKVERDRFIRHLCDTDGTLNERYDLLSNMGYGTAAHCIGLQNWGVSQYHRMSFKICKTGGITAAAVADATARADADVTDIGKITDTEFVAAKTVPIRLLKKPQLPAAQSQKSQPHVVKTHSRSIPEWDDEGLDTIGVVLEVAATELDKDNVDD